MSSHLAQRSQPPLEPPVEARSAASVDAILQATLQVLLHVGKERLTSTRVASRAGVSVGTLYQYFPNKNALLPAALKRHLAEIPEAVELAGKEQHGRTLRRMVTALITISSSQRARSENQRCSLHRKLPRGRSQNRRANGNPHSGSDRPDVSHRTRTAHDRSTSCWLHATRRNNRRQPENARIRRARKATRPLGQGADYCGARVSGSCSAPITVERAIGGAEEELSGQMLDAERL